MNTVLVTSSHVARVTNPQPDVAKDTVEVAVVQREEHTRLLAGGRHQRRIRIDLASAQP